LTEGWSKRTGGVLVKLATWQLGGRRDGPHALITGGVHGDEFEPMAAVRRLRAELLGHEIRGRVTLVPVVNEVAFRLGRRTADDGKDLARTCPGRPDGSITEQVADALSALIRTADYYIDLHTGGVQLQVYPLAGYMLHPSRDVLDCQRRMARRFGLPVIWGTDPALEGRSLSVARDAKIPAIYAEYLGGGRFNPACVSAYVQGCLHVLIDVGVIEGESAPSLGEPLIVEDERPEAGHMQICHPAPKEGFFEATVALGQHVRRGETLGVVSDILGQEPVPIPADRAGIVLVLRAFPRVSEGESVGVVLETDRGLRPFLERTRTLAGTAYVSNLH
jgi:predicted deacylase